MGGNGHAVAKLDAFFAHLNAGRYQPFDWSGNEPDLWSPWEYDYFGAPWRAQDVVRRIMVTEYHDAPVNEPGNDDLGALSSWYVWAALGLYPVTPGTADLALAAPLFPKAVMMLPSGHRLVLVAPGASDGTPYIQGVSVRATSAGSPSTRCTTDTPSSATSGRWSAPWLPAGILQTGATVQYRLGSSPDRSWGTSAAARPPSYAQGRIPSVGFTRPSGGLAVPIGATTAVTLGVQAVTPGGPPVAWQASASPGLTLSANVGTLPPSPAGRAPPAIARRRGRPPWSWGSNRPPPAPTRSRSPSKTERPPCPRWCSPCAPPEADHGAGTGRLALERSVATVSRRTARARR